MVSDFRLLNKAHLFSFVLRGFRIGNRNLQKIIKAANLLFLVRFYFTFTYFLAFLGIFFYMVIARFSVIKISVQKNEISWKNNSSQSTTPLRIKVLHIQKHCKEWMRFILWPRVPRLPISHTSREHMHYYETSRTLNIDGWCATPAMDREIYKFIFWQFHTTYNLGWLFMVKTDTKSRGLALHSCPITFDYFH